MKSWFSLARVNLSEVIIITASQNRNSERLNDIPHLTVKREYVHSTDSPTVGIRSSVIQMRPITAYFSLHHHFQFLTDHFHHPT